MINKAILSTLVVILVHSMAIAQDFMLSEYRIFLPLRAPYTLRVCNPSEALKVIDISTIDQRMDEYGQMSTVPDSIIPPNSLRNNLRFFPKQVRVAPGTCQEIQVQAKEANNLEDNEYRSYMVFTPRPPEQEETDTSTTSAAQGFAMQISVQLGSGIPVILRKNATLESVTLTNLVLDMQDSTQSTLQLTIEKQGTRSIYGKLGVEAIMPNGEAAPIKQDVTQAIYAELSRKYVTIALPTKALAAYSKAGAVRLRVVYVDNENPRAEKPTILAQAEINL